MKNNKFLKLYFLWLLFLNIVSCNVLAVTTNPVSKSTGLGSIAENVFGIAMNVHGLLKVVCITAGVGLLLSAIVRYLKYRKNPIAVTLGSIITNLVIGILLIILAFIPLSE